MPSHNQQEESIYNLIPKPKIIPPKQNNTTTMSPYSKSKVYKIVNTVNDNIYIGSTKNDLSVRFAWHMEQSCTAPSKCHRH